MGEEERKWLEKELGKELPKIYEGEIKQIKQETISQPIHRNWFERHLHLTWLFYMILVLIPIIVLAMLINLIFQVDIMGKSYMSLMWFFIATYPINIWMLRQKNREWTWSLFAFLYGFFWIPLVLSNKSGEP